MLKHAQKTLKERSNMLGKTKIEPGLNRREVAATILHGESVGAEPQLPKEIRNVDLS